MGSPTSVYKHMRKMASAFMRRSLMIPTFRASTNGYCTMQPVRHCSASDCSDNIHHQKADYERRKHEGMMFRVVRVLQQSPPE